MVDQDRQEQRDAAGECSHGSLPHDRAIACDCWAVTALSAFSVSPAPEPLVLNGHNRHVAKPGRTSRHYGVSWVPQRRRWRAGLMLQGQAYYLGLFDAEEAAAKAVTDFIEAKTNPTPGGNNGSDHRERVERFRRQAVVDGDGRAADDRAVHA